MDYNNNKKRNAALKRSNDETDVDISVGQLKDTMKSLRTTFLKEKRKEEDTKVTGTGRGQLYESSWKFFKELHFLSPFTRPVATESSLSQNSREGEAGEA